MMQNIKSFLIQRFPAINMQDEKDKTNPANSMYGLRFHKDQTPVEYLAEFLLVFMSMKGAQPIPNSSFSFKLNENEKPIYWPEDHVALKLFAFFPASKLETRHPVHHAEYLAALERVKEKIYGNNTDEKENAIKLLQSFLSGFVGVARNRTWVTHSFLPASRMLLSREVAWLHDKARKETKINDWDSSIEFFAHDRHLFMARGGELLFLQLAHLFNRQTENQSLLNELHSTGGYWPKKDLPQLQMSLVKGLTELLSGSVTKIDLLAEFIENSMGVTSPFKNANNKGKQANLGWVPSASVPEAYLFAVELDNICKSSLGELDKLDMLQQLCCLHVLRSLCFQAHRIDSLAGHHKHTDGFIGNYVWITAAPDASMGSSTRKLAQSSLDAVEEVLYRVLRIVKNENNFEDNMAQADMHGFGIFRKIGKQIDLIIPKTGGGQRFVMPPSLLSVLVAATIAPGERVRLTEFYRRVFAHFGIALAGQQINQALNFPSDSNAERDFTILAETQWVEEALQQGGYLVELSDAVSIVHNPSSKEQ